MMRQGWPGKRERDVQCLGVFGVDLVGFGWFLWLKFPAMVAACMLSGRALHASAWKILGETSDIS